MSIPHVAAAVFGTPWFVLPESMATIAEVVGLRQAGSRLASEDVIARLQAAAAAAGPRAGQRSSGAVAILPVYGTIFHRANLMTEFSGGATVQGITRAFRDAMADESVGSVLLEFDSPGGEVAGIDELASEIHRARGRKPIVAHANTLMASAAYYLAAQCDEIVAAPWAIVGSIGTVIVHQEFSRMDDAMGVTSTIIRRPEGKYRGSDLEPLDDATRDHLQSIVDDAYGQFVTAVARGRSTTVSKVKGGFGQGEVLPSQRALEAGLVDRVEPLEATIKRMASGKPIGAGPRAEALTAEVVAEAFDVPVEVIDNGSAFEAVEELRTIEASIVAESVEDAAAQVAADLAAVAADRLRMDEDAWIFGS